MGRFRGKRCARCGRNDSQAIGGLSRHHVFPKRWNKCRETAFPRGIRDNIVILCREPCHDDIGRILLERENGFGRLPITEYYEVTSDFVGGSLEPYFG